MIRAASVIASLPGSCAGEGKENETESTPSSQYIVNIYSPPTH